MGHSYNLRPKPKRYDQKYGLGIKINDKYEVVKIFGSSAIKSGIKIGDIVTKVGLKNIKGLNHIDINNLFIGNKNTKLSITVNRPIENLLKSNQKLKFVLERDNVILGSIGINVKVDYIVENNNKYMELNIANVEPNKPAYNYLKTGDRITHINGIDIKDFNESLLISLIFGYVGTSINITVARKEKPAPKTHPNIFINAHLNMPRIKTYNYTFIRE